MIEKTFITQGLKKLELDDYLAKELEKAGFTKSEIVKTPLVTRVVVHVTRPGLAIGKSGTTISQLTRTIEEKFKIDNPQLEIREIERPLLDAQAVANKLKALIERGFSWRSVVFKTVNDIQHAGSQGVEIIVSGKLAGKGGRKRRQRIATGYMKKVGEQAKLVDSGMAAAYPKVGAIGIKVKIVKPETVFPDKVNVKDFLKKLEKEKEAQQKAAAAATASAAATGSAQAAVVEGETTVAERTEKEVEIKPAEKKEHKEKVHAKGKDGKEHAHKKESSESKAVSKGEEKKHGHKEKSVVETKTEEKKE